MVWNDLEFKSKWNSEKTCKENAEVLSMSEAGAWSRARNLGLTWKKAARGRPIVPLKPGEVRKPRKSDIQKFKTSEE